MSRATLPRRPPASRTFRVGALTPVAKALRRWARYAGAVATLVALAAPAALGPALHAVLDPLGASHEHGCKCGMTPGQCGCPECARAEQERLRDRAPSAVLALKGGCDDGAPALPMAALPSGTLPAPCLFLPAPRGERLSRVHAPGAPLDRAADPPTPPPRLAEV